MHSYYYYGVAVAVVASVDCGVLPLVNDEGNGEEKKSTNAMYLRYVLLVSLSML